MRIAAFHIGLLSTAILTGCSSEKDAGESGQSLGKNVTDFAQGVGSGVDTQLKIEIELSESLTNSGVTATVAKQEAPLNNPDKSISVYFITTKAIDAVLVAKAYNADDQEIGRARTEVSIKADDAKYLGFKFPPEMDRQMVAVYRIDMQPKPTEKADSEASAVAPESGA